MGTTTSLPFKSILVVDDFVLWDNNVFLKQIESSLELEGYNNRVLANKINSETLSLCSISDLLFFILRHKLYKIILVIICSREGNKEGRAFELANLKVLVGY
jgi:hypothetical protein